MADLGGRRAPHPDEFDLSGRTALVTGGTGGLGEEICLTLARHGANVLFTHRPGGKAREAQALRRALVALGVQAAALELDLRELASIEAAVASAYEQAGEIDVLVNNAGTNVQQRALEVDEQTWDLILDTNLKGLFFTSQAVARRMAKRSRVHDMGYAIVNIASQMGHVGWFNRAAYCASKAGVVNLTRVLAVEWASFGARVNSVSPTFIHTPLADAMLADPELRESVFAQMPARRIGEPRDVALAVLYLSGSGSTMVTGHSLLVDGGWTAW
jgi:2-deoxy-D-gluconate 3-dehydrogenase